MRRVKPVLCRARTVLPRAEPRPDLPRRRKARAPRRRFPSARSRLPPAGPVRGTRARVRRRHAGRRARRPRTGSAVPEARGRRGPAGVPDRRPHGLPTPAARPGRMAVGVPHRPRPVSRRPDRIERSAPRSAPRPRPAEVPASWPSAPFPGRSPGEMAGHPAAPEARSPQRSAARTQRAPFLQGPDAAGFLPCAGPRPVPGRRARRAHCRVPGAPVPAAHAAPARPGMAKLPVRVQREKPRGPAEPSARADRSPAGSRPGPALRGACHRRPTGPCRPALGPRPRTEQPPHGRLGCPGGAGSRPAAGRTSPHRSRWAPNRPAAEHPTHPTHTKHRAHCLRPTYRTHRTHR